MGVIRDMLNSIGKAAVDKLDKEKKKKKISGPKPKKPKISKKGGGMIYKDMGGLVGGQTKLDMNKDGMITGQDFKMMPKKYGGKITYRMSGGKVASAGYDD